MTQINSIIAHIGLFFKEKIFDFSKIFSKNYLFDSPSTEIRYVWEIYLVLVALLVTGLVMQFINDRRIMPKFYRRYLHFISNSLIWFPVVLILLLFLRKAGLEPLNQRFYPVAALGIWLIYVGFLIYYRLVKVKKMWFKYREQKEQKKYFYGRKNKNRK